MLKMKMAKSYKIIMLVTALVLSTIVAFTTMSFGTAKADTVSASPSDFFAFSTDTTAEFKNDNAVFTLKKSDTIKIKNSVVVDNFFVEYKLGENVESIEIKITTDSYYVNGNKNDKGEFVKKIDNTLTVKADKTATLNGKDAGTIDGKASMQVENNFYKAGSAIESNNYYRVSKYNEYAKLVGDVEIKVNVKADTTATFELVKLSQFGDSDKAQTFKITTDGKFTESAPVISLDKAFKVVDGKVVVVAGKIEKLNYTVHSFLKGHTKSTTKIASIATADGWLNSDGKGEFRLVKGEKTMKIVDNADATKEFATITFNVLDHEATDSVKPVYTIDSVAIEAFKSALNKEITNDGACVALGTKITLPSFEDLVSDNYTAYGSLAYDLYYATPTSSTFNKTTSSLELTLNDAGDYKFFVAFKDSNGNAMEKEDFIVEGKDGEIDQVKDDMKDLVFSFHIQDDAPIEVVAASVQGKGYKGTSYTASKFKVDASGCNVTYKLYYNSSLEADEDSEWIEIPKASSITDEDYSKDGYDYDDVKAIAYNGELTFTPDKIGSYMIECTATSKVTARENTATTIIRIEKEPSVVKVDNKWLENNVWSVVFLSIGTLCLIGIIVLLCIKPKEETDND